MYCKNCGNEIHENTPFCSNCGAKTETENSNIITEEQTNSIPTDNIPEPTGKDAVLDKIKYKNCKNCGTKIPMRQNLCPNCNKKVKKPFYFRWWFITIVIIVLVSVFGSVSDNKNKNEFTTLINSQSVNSNNEYTSINTTMTNETTTKQETTTVSETTTVQETTTTAVVSANFKETMDSYEAFMDKYIAFMKKYTSGSGDYMSMLSEYTSLMAQYEDWCYKIDNINEDSLSAIDLAYYLEVTARVTKKLASVGY